MVIVGQIRKGEYFDSVSLMIVGKEITAIPGVIDAAVVMGTNENRSILNTAGLLVSDFDHSDDTDLLIAVKAESQAVVDEVFEKVTVELENARKKGDEGEEFSPRSFEGAVKMLPDANLAMISVAGKYAGAEAMKALEKGLHVMLFSDNIPVETEIQLKNFARDKGLLVMGPDCGTAIINGVPLAFANVVNRGDIGIVAASGTGLQELTTLISNEGRGISQAIGTGGRDLKKEVGGIMFIEALKALLADEQTKVIVLAGKPPHPDVLSLILRETESSQKPLIGAFLGADIDALRAKGIKAYKTFHEAAVIAVCCSLGKSVAEWEARMIEHNEQLKKDAISASSKRSSGQKYIRGLFSGGTFCCEAQVVLGELGLVTSSNAPLKGHEKLQDSLKSVKHTVVDLGEDEFTVGRPHPMIDYTLRNQRIIEEAKDPETAIILLDVVLGYGSNMSPAEEILPVIKEAVKNVEVVCSVTGTERDPQHRHDVVSALKNAGATVITSNAMACRYAGNIIMGLEG